MRRLLLAALLTFILSGLQAADRYLIRFSDKKNSPYSVTRPQEFLSDKAIARRLRQNISISASDLPVNPNYLQGLQSAGAKIVSTSKWLNAALCELSSPADVAEIRKLPFVSSVQYLSAGTITTVPELASQPVTEPAVPSARAASSWYDYGLSYNQVHMINADCMHANGFRGEGMTIAVLDGGFFKVDSLPAFDSLRNQGGILGTRDFVTGDTMVYEDYQHGMNVLSCMAGNLPGRIVGTAPRAKYWLLRTEEVASETMQEEIYWAMGAEFADSVGADIINSSLGYSLFNDSAENHSYADMDGNTTIVTIAADLAASKGMIVCNSAGNSGGAPWFKITAPADGDSVLTVGAVDSIQNIAAFSSRGPTYDGRIKPDVCAQGVNTIIAFGGGDVIPSGGTSFSCPLTAGAIACLWQQHPTRTNMELIDAVRSTANQSWMPDSIKGYGVPNFCAAAAVLVGIEENANTGTVDVYPNPFSEELHLEASANEQILSVRIYDITGRLLSAKTTNASGSLIIADAASLAPGSYMIRIETSKQITIRKLIKK